MVEKASFNYERSVNGVEAFEVGFKNDNIGGGWSYKTTGAITGIFITNSPSSFADKHIVSLAFQCVDEKGMVEYSHAFGLGTFPSADKIMLDWPEEYLTSLRGSTLYEASHRQYNITSLSFETNKRKLGPYGPKVTKNTFQIPLKDRVIVGFYGMALSTHIRGGLGVYVRPSSDFSGPSRSLPAATKIQFGGSYKEEECIKLESWGWEASLEDQPWSYMLKDSPTTIQIGQDEYRIQSISFKSSSDNKEFKYAQNRDDSSRKYNTFTINSPDEYLIAVEGTTREHSEDIQSICFLTNKSVYGYYGAIGRRRFRFYSKGMVIAGFHGTVGKLFHSFGVYIKPLAELGNGRPEKNPPRRDQEGSHNNEESTSIPPNGGQGGSHGKEGTTETPPSGGREGSQDNQGSIVVPPQGGKGGKEWDYKPNGAITEIKIKYGWVIDSLTFQSLDKDNIREYSSKFGGEGGEESIVKIDWPNEYLTSISGTHNTFENERVIESLCFHTVVKEQYGPFGGGDDKKTYGPFGRPTGEEFEISLKDGVIVGFHGRQDKRINALGVYFKSPMV